MLRVRAVRRDVTGVDLYLDQRDAKGADECILEEAVCEETEDDPRRASRRGGRFVRIGINDFVDEDAVCARVAKLEIAQRQGELDRRNRGGKRGIEALYVYRGRR